VTIAGPPRYPVWCRLYSTVYWIKRPGNTQNGGTVLPIANLMVDYVSGSPDSYSSFLVTICLSRLVSEMFACNRQTDRRTSADHYYSWPSHCGGPAKKTSHYTPGWLIQLKYATNRRRKKRTMIDNRVSGYAQSLRTYHDR